MSFLQFHSRSMINASVAPLPATWLGKGTTQNFVARYAVDAAVARARLAGRSGRDHTIVHTSSDACTMKFDFDSPGDGLSITGYAAGWIRVGDQRITEPCVVSPSRIIRDLLPSAPELITTEHVTSLAGEGADIVLLGTGATQRLVAFELVHQFAAHAVGLEIMDTGAACRSFNVLAAEGRAVIAALYMI